MARVVTIGVYGFGVGSFLEALREADVRLLVDVRQRRGVRGAAYAWANSGRLRAALEEAGISYEHARELAPPAELRELQHLEDARQGVGIRSRSELAPAFRDGYLDRVLARADLAGFVERLPTRGATALLCVEALPQACHRALLAERLAADHGVSVRHLSPP